MNECENSQKGKTLGQLQLAIGYILDCNGDPKNKEGESVKKIDNNL